MPIWDKIFGQNTATNEEHHYDSSRYAFIDIEVGLRDHKIHDIGAIRYDGAIYHAASRDGLMNFLKDVDYICGHNIIHHDAKYLFWRPKSPLAIGGYIANVSFAFSGATVPPFTKG